MVAVGNANNSIAYSSDGITWTPVIGSTSIFTTGFCVTWNGSLFIAGGTGDGAAFATSPDGINWVAQTSPLSGCNGVAWNGALFVGVGVGAGGSGVSAVYSSNGQAWLAAATSPFDITGNGVAWNGHVWVAVGDGSAGSIATSTDGSTWTSVAVDPFWEVVPLV